MVIFSLFLMAAGFFTAGYFIGDYQARAEAKVEFQQADGGRGSLTGVPMMTRRQSHEV